jgi:hypothetical protein
MGMPPTAAMPPVPPAGPPPTAYAAQPPAGPPPKKSKGPVLAIVALLVAIAAVGSFLVLGGDDDGGGEAIVLEPISATLRDDFAGNLDVDTPSSSIEVAVPDVPAIGGGIGAALAGRTADGDEPGLYGGSRDAAVCDVEQLVEFLTDDDNADKAEAWAEVQGIDVDEIEDFIRELTPVRLRFDTRVTNHGFRDGEATPLQSILERGTAVLVDDRGVPRVKCNCGNPLAEPADVGGLDDDEALDLDARAQNPEDAWDDFDPEQVVVVDASTTINVFVLVDIDTGEAFERPIGTNGDADTDIGTAGDVGDICDKLPDSPTCSGELPPDDTTTTTGGEETTTTSTTIELGTGDVQVTLQWDSAADLDLAVTDPAGDEVSFSSRSIPSGGQLDVDSNIGCDPEGSIENVFWPPGQAPAGTYTVTVTAFTAESCSQGAQSGAYVLTIRVAGQDDQVIQGEVDESAPDTFTFVA